MSEFFRYPHTAHLAWLGQTLPRDDKVITKQEAERLLSLGGVVIEEKLDGANVGISLDGMGQVQFQNRGQFLPVPYTGQFARLNGWAVQHEAVLIKFLSEKIILFGEWMAAQHSIIYDRLPDWFVGFDIFDKEEEKFWSVDRRNDLLSSMDIANVPILFRGKANLSDIEDIVLSRKSSFSKDMIEGVVIRSDGNQFNNWKAKIVRPDFVQGIEGHWRKASFRWNRVV